jgi:NAD(P)-dependent dehydrogenase (short-subunit alcohol dehydrogenase family)
VLSPAGLRQPLRQFHTGAFLFTKYVARLVIDQSRRGSIINIISTTGHRGSDAQVQVLLNTCTHRGALVCRQPSGNAKSFQSLRGDGAPRRARDRCRPGAQSARALATFGPVAEEIAIYSSRMRQMKEEEEHRYALAFAIPV